MLASIYSADMGVHLPDNIEGVYFAAKFGLWERASNIGLSWRLS